MPHYTLSDPLAVRVCWYPKLTAGLLYDFRSDPRVASITTSKGRSIDPLNPATDIPTRFMRIIIRPAASLELSVDVSSRTYVTIGQVLYTLRQKLLQPISYHEWNKLTPREQRRVAEAFHRRVEASRYPRYERDSGVRGMDLLLGDSKFHGLKPSSRGPNIWKLVLR